MFTDHIGNPINDGDTVVYPDQRGVFNIGTVHRVVPLVPHHSASNNKTFMREDQAGKAHPTSFTSKDYEDPAKRYVVQVMKPKWRHRRDRVTGDWISGEVLTKYTLPTRHVIVLPPGTVAK